jgi:hypothetical protein
MLLVDTRSVPGRLQKNHLKEHKSRNFSKEEKGLLKAAIHSYRETKNNLFTLHI